LARHRWFSPNRAAHLSIMEYPGAPKDAFIAALVESIASRSAVEREELAAATLRHVWPVGPVDRTVPAALEWLRRWGPKRSTISPPDCSCAIGHCALCN
jgi:hypothetical protein